jgi:hypothetical protein
MPTSPPTPQQPQPPATTPTPDVGQQPEAKPQVVFMSRPMDPQNVEISEAAMQRHLESRKKFPDLNLSEGEFVVSALDRHPIGLVVIWGLAGASIVVIFAALFYLVDNSDSAGLGAFASGMSPAVLAIPVFLIIALILIFAFIATFIYNANRFFLTNESVIQHIQTGLFSKRQQTVSLANVEDASFTQDGIVPHLFDYGMIRLSTEGDETTYRFNFASRPQYYIGILNNAVEAFKNGRPVTGGDD